jgi:hypothetical protein
MLTNPARFPLCKSYPIQDDPKGDACGRLTSPHGTIVRQFMPLAAGNWLGPYGVLASVGTGGMGEVCRAPDTKLGRVAEAFVQLDHPNIVTIHFLTMQLGRQKADAIEAFDEKLMKHGLRARRQAEKNLRRSQPG